MYSLPQSYNQTSKCKRCISSNAYVVFVDDFNYFIELDFIEGIGVVEIVISQSGSVIYSSSENILSPLRKYLQLPFGVSGEYCIEIKGDNGAYVYGCFEL